MFDNTFNNVTLSHFMSNNEGFFSLLAESEKDIFLNFSQDKKFKKEIESAYNVKVISGNSPEEISTFLKKKLSFVLKNNLLLNMNYLDDNHSAHYMEIYHDPNTIRNLNLKDKQSIRITPASDLFYHQLSEIRLTINYALKTIEFSDESMSMIRRKYTPLNQFLTLKFEDSLQMLFNERDLSDQDKEMATLMHDIKVENLPFIPHYKKVLDQKIEKTRSLKNIFKGFYK